MVVSLQNADTAIPAAVPNVARDEIHKWASHASLVGIMVLRVWPRSTPDRAREKEATILAFKRNLHVTWLAQRRAVRGFLALGVHVPCPLMEQHV